MSNVEQIKTDVGTGIDALNSTGLEWSGDSPFAVLRLAGLSRSIGAIQIDGFAAILDSSASTVLLAEVNAGEGRDRLAVVANETDNKNIRRAAEAAGITVMCAADLQSTIGYMHDKAAKVRALLDAALEEAQGLEELALTAEIGREETVQACATATEQATLYLGDIA